jgi:hypothetical protein
VNGGTLFANTSLTTTAITAAAGAAIGGSGTVGSVTMSAGALVAPGDGVGKFTVADSLVLTGSSGYLWQLTNATGTAGSTTGWDLLTVTGTLNIAATSADPFQIDLWTASSGSPVTSGSAANFNREQSYTWKIATAAGGITGFASNKFVINTSATNGTGGFANTFTGGTFSLAQSGNDLNLVFTGAPPSVITINVASGTQTQTQAGYPLLSGSTPVLKTGGGTLVVDQAKRGIEQEGHLVRLLICVVIHAFNVAHHTTELCRQFTAHPTGGIVEKELKNARQAHQTLPQIGHQLVSPAQQLHYLIQV